MVRTRPKGGRRTTAVAACGHPKVGFTEAPQAGYSTVEHWVWLRCRVPAVPGRGGVTRAARRAVPLGGARSRQRALQALRAPFSPRPRRRVEVTSQGRAWEVTSDRGTLGDLGGLSRGPSRILCTLDDRVCASVFGPIRDIRSGRPRRSPDAHGVRKGSLRCAGPRDRRVATRRRRLAAEPGQAASERTSCGAVPAPPSLEA
jgi:hypothetical protein